MTELTIPEFIVDEFGTPEAWSITVVDTASAEVPHWRTLAYTGALRQLEVALRDAGKDIHSGEWRVYEVAPDEVDLIGPGLVEAPEEGETLESVRAVMAVARGVTDGT